MEDIIALGLLYRLIAKNEKTMSHSMASDYIAEVNKGLNKLNSYYNIHTQNKRFQECYELGIDEQNGNYYFSDLNKDILAIYDVILESDLLTASLSPEALDALGIKELPLSRTEKIQFGLLELSVMSKESALETAKRILEDDGFRAIRLPLPILGSNGYEVRYSAKYTALKLDYQEEMSKNIMDLYLALKRHQEKMKICASMEPTTEITLDKLLLAETFRYEGETQVDNRKRVIFPLDGDASHASYFADFFDDSIMNYFPTSDTSGIRVDEAISLEEVMQARYDRVESIQEFLNKLNKEGNKTLMKNIIKETRI